MKVKFYSLDDPIPKEALARLESDIRREAKYHELVGQLEEALTHSFNVGGQEMIYAGIIRGLLPEDT